MQLGEEMKGRGAKAPPRSPPAPYEKFNYMPIAGKWREGGSAKRVLDRDPYNGEPLVEIPLANKSDLDDAYHAAAKTQRKWCQALPQERRRILEGAAAVMGRRKEEIVDWLIRESGSTRIKATLEWDLARMAILEASSFPFHVTGKILPADIPGKENRVYRQPVGVVGVISPWNFPLHLSLRSVAPALALGNGVVLKPSSDTPVTGGLLVAKIFEEAGLPSGLLSVIVGSGSEIGDAFVDHPIPRVISFTGSTPVGRGIAERAGRNVKRVCLELGGNAPFIVLEDADLERAVGAAVVGKFLHQGQICMAINRIIVEAPLYEAFVDRFAERVSTLHYGDPMNPNTVVGPLINQRQFDSVDRKVRQTLDRGARVVMRGENRGLVYAPTVLADVTNDMPAAREELFGPVASMLRAKDPDDAVRIANDTEYGLSSAIFTRDLERGERLALRIEAGMTHLNDMPVNDAPNTAFGGEKASGLGRFGGEWAVEAFSTDHWISVQHAPRTYPF
jgi:acyl-CoA reductase-like NAD-dependent aldehyde dehydrogenase